MDTDNALSKVPEVTLAFWIMKVMATTLGETGGDAVSMSMDLGYLVGTAGFAVIFVAAVAAQVRAKGFHPITYWVTIVASTTVGTTLADFATSSMPPAAEDLGYGRPGAGAGLPRGASPCVRGLLPSQPCQPDGRSTTALKTASAVTGPRDGSATVRDSGSVSPGVRAPAPATAPTPPPRQGRYAGPFAPRNPWKAAVTFDGDTVTKDYSRNGLLARLWGWLCIRREAAALSRLAGVPGVPALRGPPTRYAIRIEAVPGVPLASLRRGDVDAEFLDRLGDLMDRVHGRGIAHRDAHLRNILVANGEPYLVDFATACRRGRVPGLSRWLFARWVLLDRERLYKVEKRFFARGTPPRMFLLYRLVKGLRRWSHG